MDKKITYNLAHVVSVSVYPGGRTDPRYSYNEGHKVSKWAKFFGDKDVEPGWYSCYMGDDLTEEELMVDHFLTPDHKAVYKPFIRLTFVNDQQRRDIPFDSMEEAEKEYRSIIYHIDPKLSCKLN